jgi:hypothetical protein
MQRLWTVANSGLLADEYRPPPLAPKLEPQNR